MYIAQIYLKHSCPYCKEAKLLLKKHNIFYKEIDIELNKIYLLEMIKKSNRKTVPQIFINKKHIGGYDDLCILLKENNLFK
ncbi:glutaredoxin 3 [Wigglesworthia glossinidia endosymbiont of Glossina morsitans morsitans (Yale colony)]|uniref:Glutaredoxin n=1 Tax=Wigglesworthia glossinidia endosymbiont of Glossina morsitans morsitans (Yale colony) TaxID=1142511 RepID=H6Q4J6_WIGGL|nr:glutaredoxin 3 [Wigglesworthia glossinidia]AFA41056.1 glutaredoxin 3 [Wigglesworthia glossinidia endosymbiont of Glossina morsitans morsitans (Yale colony)]